MKNKFEKTFEQLADFHTLAGYDGWMIGACVYAQREAAGERVSGTEFGCGNDLTVVQNQKIKIQNSCKSEIVKETASFAVMRNQMEEDGIVYQLELHVVKPEVQGAVTSKQAGMEKNMAMNVEKSKLEEQRMNLHHSVGTEENADTGGEKTFFIYAFRYPSICGCRRRYEFDSPDGACGCAGAFDGGEDA